MNNKLDLSDEEDQGATLVITHRVKDGYQESYENWLNEIGPLCRASIGHMDWQIIRPVKTLTATYSVIIRFDTREHLQNWVDSTDRKRLIEKIRPLLTHDDDFFIRSGLDFWFIPEGAKAKVPARWKQFIVTWSAIYPLALTIPLIILPLLRQLEMPTNRYIDTLFVTGAVVLLMVTLVMPNYTKLIRRWFFK